MFRCYRNPELQDVVYRRDLDQARARRQSQVDTLRQQLAAAGPDAHVLVDRLLALTWLEAVADQDDVLRRIGGVLLINGRRDLWQLVYLEANRGSAYVLGDETRFLLNEPLTDSSPPHDADGSAA